ncbi:E [Phaffia rhodozyma]|uniref:E n=1 Tax=Phaffia rhodozyma TaxID=264483 RepID=A0A0F7SKE6_PHARH|nr:E [Phaffia rhodozyma] [Phaffia rhodozyma]
MTISNESTVAPLKIAIIGGGIAGLAAAMGVLKHQKEGANVEVVIYEAAHEFKEIGAGVSFGPNAQRALHMIGLGNELDSISGGDPGGSESDDVWFDVYVGEKQTVKSEREMICKVEGKDSAKGSVHRADFLNKMANLVPEPVKHLNHRCSSYETILSEEGENAGGKVLLRFAETTDQNGNKFTPEDVKVDVVLASDGIKSLMRKCLYKRRGLDGALEKYSGWIAWRGLIDQAEYHDIMGKDASTKLLLLGQDKHILTFPIKHGKVVNLVIMIIKGSEITLDRSPRIDPNPNFWRTKPHSMRNTWLFLRYVSLDNLSNEQKFNLCIALFLKAIEDPSIWGIFDLPVLEHTIDHHLALIGDSAHATTPHQGAGAGQAVEDSLFITAILCSPVVCSAPLTERSAKVQKALELYAKVRHTRGGKVQTTSAEAGKLYEFNEVNGEGKDLEKIKQNLIHRMGWIWDWDVEAELKTALKELEELC